MRKNLITTETRLIDVYLLCLLVAGLLLLGVILAGKAIIDSRTEFLDDTRIKWSPPRLVIETNDNEQKTPLSPAKSFCIIL